MSLLTWVTLKTFKHLICSDLRSRCLSYLEILQCWYLKQNPPVKILMIHKLNFTFTFPEVDIFYIKLNTKSTQSALKVNIYIFVPMIGKLF